MISKELLRHYGINHVAEYVRKSRNNKGEDEEQTLQKHKSRMDRFIMDYRLTADVFAEIGTSVKIEQRLEFMELLEQIDKESNKFDAILVVETDRLTRSNGDFERVAEVLSFNNVNLIVLGENRIYDLNNSSDVQTLKFRVFGASLEYEYTKHRLNEGRKESARNGNYVAGVTPFGYSYDRDSKKLVINPSEAIIVRKMFDLYMSGLSFKKVALELNQQGYKTRNGNLFRDNNIIRSMTNRVYIGELSWNKTRTRSTNKGKVLKARDKDQWIIVPNAHEAIIDTSTYNAFLKEKVERRTYSKRSMELHPLKGLILCPECGKPLPIVYKHRKYYTKDYIKTCNRYDKATGVKTCTKHVGQSLDGVVELITSELMQYKEHLSINADTIVRGCMDKQERNSSLERKHLIALTREQQNIEEKIEKLFNHLENDIISPTEFKKRINIHKKRLATITQEIDKISSEYEHDLFNKLSEWQIRARIRAITMYTHKIISDLPNVDRRLQREILHTFVDHITHRRSTTTEVGSFEIHFKDIENLVLQTDAIQSIAESINTGGY